MSGIVGVLGPGSVRTAHRWFSRDAQLDAGVLRRMERASGSQRTGVTAQCTKQQSLVSRPVAYCFSAHRDVRSSGLHVATSGAEASFA
jgi:hypothetical protein